MVYTMAKHGTPTVIRRGTIHGMVHGKFMDEPMGYATGNYGVSYGSPEGLTHGRGHGFTMEHNTACPMGWVTVWRFSMKRTMGRTISLIIRGLHHGFSVRWATPCYTP